MDFFIFVFAFKVGSIPVQRIFSVEKIRAFKDVADRNNEGRSLDDNSPQFSGEIESHLCETLQKIVYGKKCGAFIVLRPDAPCEGADGIGLCIISACDDDILADCFDDESVTDHFFDINAVSGGKCSRTHIDIVSFAGNCCNRDLCAEDLRKKLLQLRRRKTGDFRSLCINNDDRIAPRQTCCLRPGRDLHLPGRAFHTRQGRQVSCGKKG